MTFNERDFSTLRKFQDRMAKEFGETAYVGTNSATVLVEYSPELKAMIRPLPPDQHFEFALKLLSCLDCKKKQLFLCLTTQESYLCDECSYKRKLKGVPKKVNAE